MNFQNRRELKKVSLCLVGIFICISVNVEKKQIFLVN